jgi:hypothetical protein
MLGVLTHGRQPYPPGMDNLAQQVTAKHAHAVQTYGLPELKQYYREQGTDELVILRKNWPWPGEKSQLDLLWDELEQRRDEEEEQAGREETVLGGVRHGDVVPSPPEEEAQPDAATEEQMSGSKKHSATFWAALGAFATVIICSNSDSI